MEIKSIGVLGAGVMGNGISQAFAQAGYQVIMRDIEDRFVEGGMKNINKNLSRSVSKERINQSYGITSGRLVSLRELVSTFERKVGKLLLIEWGGRSYRKREVMQPWGSYSQLPEWQPKIDLGEGIELYLQG